MKKLVIVFVKNPILGKCKTRLAMDIGEENALDIYNQLLKHTAKVVSKVTSADRAVFYSEKIQHNDFWEASKFQKKVQSKGHLGQKMQAAFEWGFAQGYRSICIIGSDLLALKTTDIDRAFDHLVTANLVFGPATDGGYYLMGMNKLYEKTFENKAWSTETVLQKTLEDVNEKHLAFLDTKTDIDTVNDLMIYPEFHRFIPNSILKQHHERQTRENSKLP